jgi:hypothetical protein
MLALQWVTCVCMYVQLDGGESTIHPVGQPSVTFAGFCAHLPCIPDRSADATTVTPSRAGSGLDSSHH